MVNEGPVDLEAMAHEVTRAVANLREVFAPIDEATAGYRAQLEAAGWSPQIAEQMADRFHALLIGMFARGLTSG